MQKLYAIFIVFFCAFNSFAQDIKIPLDSIKNGLIATTNSNPINGLLPSITPKSPTMSALGRYDEHPISMYTGLPIIEIPIFEIEAGGIKVPIKLSYHAGGNKVSDIASLIGLGWSMNLGSVSRTMQGIPDEKPISGYLNGSFNLNLNATLGDANCGTAYQNLLDFHFSLNDNGADMFSFNSPMGSGKFMLQANQNHILIPDDHTKISYNKDNSSLTHITDFTLINESGYTFKYAYPEKSEYKVGFGSTTLPFYNSWQLSSIDGLNPKDQVKFNYRSESFAHSLEDFTQQIILTETFSPQGYTKTEPAPGSVGDRNYENVRYPSEIIFPTGKVVFVPEITPRTDVPYTTYALWVQRHHRNL
jgi:hypothetical protein